jgi:hypothetical protein
MLDDTEATAPEGSSERETVTHAEPDAPSPEASETEASGEGEEGQGEAEEIEFDFGGNKLRVPKGAIPDEVAEQLEKFTKGTWSDYTRRSGELAAAAKALEAEKSAVQKVGTLRAEALEVLAEGMQLRSELARLQQVDLNALWQSDPDQARRVSDLRSQTEARFNQTVSRLSQLENAGDAAEQQAAALVAEQGHAKIAKAVKGFDPAKVIEYAVKNYGISETVARNYALNPEGTIMAWKAMQFDALQANAAKAAKPAAPPPPPRSVHAKQDSYLGC